MQASNTQADGLPNDRDYNDDSEENQDSIPFVRWKI
jgi:hypothetical protein